MNFDSKNKKDLLGLTDFWGFSMGVSRNYHLALHNLFPKNLDPTLKTWEVTGHLVWRILGDRAHNTYAKFVLYLDITKIEPFVIQNRTNPYIFKRIRLVWNKNHCGSAAGDHFLDIFAKILNNFFESRI
jgi:hypothetical protein